ncbi:MAG: hypothetical protein O9277_16320 [Magnetospirillum sp.]|nr:hypothetical protein [Magnetospirillum sp.]
MDVGAAMGRSGTWLLDPRNVTIANATVGGTLAANVFDPTADDATIDVAAITAALNVGTSVEITTGTTGAQAGNITVGTAIAKTAGGNAVLTLNAAGAISVDYAITSTTGALGLNLWAGGNIQVNAPIATNGGALATAGTGGVGFAGGNFANTAGGTINTGFANLSLSHAGSITIGGTLTALVQITLNANGATTQTAALLGNGGLSIGGGSTGAVTLTNPANAFGTLTVTRAGTGSNIELVTTLAPTMFASTLGTGSFSLTGPGFAQAGGGITQDAGGGAVTIDAGTANVTLTQPNTWSGDLTISGGLITISSAQTFNNAAQRTARFLSTGDIDVNSSLQATGAGALNMVFNARASGAASGAIHIEPMVNSISLSTNGGYIVMGGGTTALGDSLPGVGSEAVGGGTYFSGISILGATGSLGVTIDTNGGGFYASGIGAAAGTKPRGVVIYSTAYGGPVSISTGTGTIGIKGAGGNSAEGDGIFIQGLDATNTASLITTSGSITLQGTSGTGSDSNGILAAYFSAIQTNTGTMTLTGTAAAAAGNNSRGIWSLGRIDTGTGTTTISATSNSTAPGSAGLFLTAGADWRTSTGGTISATVTGAPGHLGVGIIDGTFTLNGGDINITGTGGTGGEGIHVTGSTTMAGANGMLTLTGTGAGTTGNILFYPAGAFVSTGTTSGRSLVVTSTGDITVQGTATADTISATAGGLLDISMTAGRKIETSGRIATQGGNLSLIASQNVFMAAGLSTAGGNITIWGNAPGGTPSATPSSGNVTGVAIRRNGADAVGINAGTGNISIAGAGGDTGNSIHGVLLDGVTLVTAGAGAVSIIGKGGTTASGFNHVGVYINGDTALGTAYSIGTAITSGSGGVSITGYGGLLGTSDNVGVAVARATVTANDGTVTVVGQGGAGTASRSIELAGGNVLATGAGGSVTLQALPPLGSGNGIVLRDSYDLIATAVTLGGANLQGDLTIETDTIARTATTLSLTGQATGALRIRPNNAATAIDVGFAGSGTLQLTPYNLGAVSGFTEMVVGSASQTGAITTGGSWTLARNASLVGGTGTVTLGDTALGGYILSIEGGGSIGQTVATGITGTGTLALLGNGNVVLTNAANTFTNLQINKFGTPANVSVSTGSTLSLAASSMGTGTLSLTGNGFSQTGGLTQDPGGGAVTIDGGTGTVAFGQANTFTGDLSATGGYITISALQTLSRAGLQSVGLTSTVGGVLVQGNIVKSGTGGANIHMSGKETVRVVNAVVDSGGGNITLWGNAPGGDSTAGTQVGTAWGIEINGATAELNSGAGNISLVGKGATDAAGQHGMVIHGGAKILSTSGSIALQGRGADGAAAGSQGIIFGTSFAGAATIETQTGAVTLTGWGGASSPNANAITIDVTSTILATTGANIALDGTGTNTGTGIYMAGAPGLNAGTGNLSLTSNNTLNIGVSTLSAGGNIQLSGTSLTLGNTTSGGNLTLIATNGGVSLTSPLSVGGNFSASATNGSLVLDESNSIVGSVSLTTTGAGSINWKQSNAMQIAGIASTGSLDIEVTSGSISQVGAITTSGDVTLNAANGNITLTNASNAFGGALSLTATSGSASVTTAGALQIGAFDVANNLTVVAGAAVTQSGIIDVGGTTSLSGGTMTLTNPSNDFGTSLTVAGAGGTLDGSVASTAGSAALAVPGAVTALGTGFTFGGAPIQLAPPPAPVVTVTDTTTNQQIAQVIAAILASVVSSTTATTADGTGAAAIVAPAALQAALAAVLEEAATQQNQQQSAEPGGAVLVTPATGPAPTAGAPQAPAVPGVFAVGTTITISTSGGTTAVTITPPAGGGPPRVILPGLLNLNPPRIPSITQFGIPGIASNSGQFGPN